MKRTIYLISTLVLGFVVLSNCKKDSSPDKDPSDLEIIVPEDAGYSSDKLNEAYEFAAQSGYDAVIALYKGKVLFSWGQVDENFNCHSIWKPFVSALYGISVEQGEINLDLTLKELEIDDIEPSLMDEEKQATIRDILKSRSGVYHEAAAETQEMKDMRPERGSHPHNTYFYYNNWDFNVGAAIYEQLTGKYIFDEFEKEIADPIGMQDFDVTECFKAYESNLSMYPSWRFKMSARDLARFGALYQKKGMWNDSQIISQEWISESTTSYSVMDSTTGIGYGYRWKVIPENSPFAQMIGSKGFFHTGIGMQIVLVLEDMNLVIVELKNTDEDRTDPGDAGMELGLMIINARL